MVTIALYNFKGGVGKTTTAVNLAYLASHEGRKTLLWDLDPQGSASFFCKVNTKLKGGAKKLMAGMNPVLDSIRETDYENLDVLPADFSIRNIDIILEETKKSKKKLRSVTDEFAKKYDFTFIDCPPGLSVLSEHIFKIADCLLIPIIPSILSIRTYNQVIDYFMDNNLNSASIIPFFSMVDMRKTIHKDIMESCFAGEFKFLKTFIKSSSEIERMGIERQPLPAFAPNSKSSEAYKNLWKELKKNLR